MWRPLRVVCPPVVLRGLSGSDWRWVLLLGDMLLAPRGFEELGDDVFISSSGRVHLGWASARWRLFLRYTPPFGVSMRYDRGSGHCSRMVAGSHRPVRWSWTRTSCPGVRGGRSRAVLSWWCFLHFGLNYDQLTALDAMACVMFQNNNDYTVKYSVNV